MTSEAERSTPVWSCLDAEAQLWAATYYVPGFQCRTVAVPLEGKGWLILSPGASLAATLPPELLQRGKPELLLIPNGFHHLGIEAWQRVYPAARACGAEAARKRAMKVQAGRQLEGLAEVKARLPHHVQLLELPGTRIGEVWLSTRSQQGVSWAVGDAFFNIPTLPKHVLRRWVFQLLGSAPGLRISQLMKWGGFADRVVVRRWLLEQLAQDRPSRLVPNHGDVLDDALLGKGQVSQRLQGLIEARL